MDTAWPWLVIYPFLGDMVEGREGYIPSTLSLVPCILFPLPSPAVTAHEPPNPARARSYYVVTRRGLRNSLAFCGRTFDRLGCL